MAALPEDEELKTLLKELNSDDQKPTIKSSKSKDTEEQGDDYEDEDVPQHQPDIIQLPVSQEEKDNDDNQNDEKDNNQDDETNKINLNAIYDEAIEELLRNYRKDRKDIDDFIGYVYTKLKKTGESRILFESLSTALRTKSEANSNLIKLLDNITKRTQQTGDDGLDDLDEIL